MAGLAARSLIKIQGTGRAGEFLKRGVWGRFKGLAMQPFFRSWWQGEKRLRFAFVEVLVCEVVEVVIEATAWAHERGAPEFIPGEHVRVVRIEGFHPVLMTMD